jgi:hypothetical protein
MSYGEPKTVNNFTSEDEFYYYEFLSAFYTLAEFLKERR